MAEKKRERKKATVVLYSNHFLENLDFQGFLLLLNKPRLLQCTKHTLGKQDRTPKSGDERRRKGNVYERINEEGR